MFSPPACGNCPITEQDAKTTGREIGARSSRDAIARTAGDYFNIPAAQVIELGTKIEI